jgi:hypothetical protein
MKTKDLVKLARGKKTNEEVEQIDELSPATLGSYKTKAAGSEKAMTDKSSSLSVPAKDRNAAAIKANQRRQGMKLATKKLGEEVELEEAHMSEKDAERLAQKHVNAAKSAKKAGDLKGHDAHAKASNDIRDMILKHTDSPKGIPSGKMQRTAEKLFSESSELEEGIQTMSDARLKFHALKSVPHGSYTKKEIAAEHNRRHKTGGAEYRAVKPSLNEEEVEQVDEISSALLHRAKQAAQKKAGWLMPGDKGKGDKAWNRVKKFRDAGVAKEKKEKSVVKEGLRSSAKGNEKGRNYDPNKLYHQTGYKAKNYRRPWEKSKADLNFDFEKAMKGFTGAIQKLPPGKKTPKAQVRPRDYMKPNQASKVGVSEQTLSTHPATSLASRSKRVKSFHAWEPKDTNEANRVADVRMVKVRLPDGKLVYRKEHSRAEVQHEAAHTHPTGKTPYGGMTNKELRADLTKKTKAASEAYTGSEPTSSNKNDPSNRFVGTDAIRKNYAAATPGQTVAEKHLNDIKRELAGIRESRDLNESFAAGFELAPFARDYGIQVQSSFTHHPEVQQALEAQEDAMNEAIYQGRNVALNKPMKGDVKKSKVYVRDPSTGNIKKVNFGDKTLSIKKDQPGRKRSYCARSGGQGNLTKKTSANYWSRRAWDC